MRTSSNLMRDRHSFDAADLQVSSKCKNKRSNSAEGEITENNRVAPRRAPTNHSRSVWKRPTTPRQPRLALQKPRDTGSATKSRAAWRSSGRPDRSNTQALCPRERFAGNQDRREPPQAPPGFDCNIHYPRRAEQIQLDQRKFHAVTHRIDSLRPHVHAIAQAEESSALWPPRDPPR